MILEETSPLIQIGLFAFLRSTGIMVFAMEMVHLLTARQSYLLHPTLNFYLVDIVKTFGCWLPISRKMSASLI